MNTPRVVCRLPWTAWLAILLVTFAMSASPGRLAAQEVRYNRDVLQILSEHCFACHGFDSGKRQAGLRLDRFEGATRELDSGVRAIVPGDVQHSELLRRIDAADADEVMPPPETLRRLTSAQKATLRRWIEQ